LADPGQKLQNRQIAYKKSIAELINAGYIKPESHAANFLQADGQGIAKVNIIAAVVGRADFQNYINISIDDGTGKISARAFDNAALVGGIKVGDVVMIIGRPREFSSEKYILIEAIKSVSPAWAKFRKMELGGMHKQGESANKFDAPNNANNMKTSGMEVSYSNPNSRIVRMIKDLDKGDGVSIDDLLSKGIENADAIIGTLLRKGDIFETRPGKVKVLE